MPVSLNIKIKYFSGTMDNPSAIYDEIDKWLRETKHAGYQINSTVHFHEDDLVWHMLVTVMYKEQPGVGVLRPELMLNPRQAD